MKVQPYTDARIDLTQGVLICSSVNDSAMAAISGGIGLGVYHIYDIPLYYYNLREKCCTKDQGITGEIMECPISFSHALLTE